MRPFIVLVGLLIGIIPGAAQDVDAGALMRAALQKAQAGDYPAALQQMQEAAVLRPAHPIYLYNLACLQSLAGQTEAALGTLRQIADHGLYMPAAQDGDLGSLFDLARFKEIAAQLERNREPRGEMTTALVLENQTGLIEGIARRESTGEFFFGDMHHRCIWRRATDGALSRFTAADDTILGIGGLVVDEARNRLWAAASAQQVIAEWSENLADRSALLAFALDSGELKGVYPVPADGTPHATVDLTVGPDGTVYLSDSLSPVVWTLSPGADALEPWFTDPRFRSLQGLAVSADGAALYAADYALGLFKIDLATRAASLLAADGNTLIGIDGLARAGQKLVAVQNGVNPKRVLLITPDPADGPASVRELAAARPEMSDPTLGCVADGVFYFIGHAGWDKFESNATVGAGHDCPVLGVAF